MIDIVMLKNRVMRELGISGVAAQSQYEALDELGDRVMQAVLVSTYQAVPENLRTEFMRLTDMGHPHEIKAFLDKYVPNAETISARAIEREVKEFKDELQKQLKS